HTRFSRDWSSDVCSSDLAKIRCSRETPPPVIQCLCPLIMYLSPRFSARVVIAVVSEPASGSVMQIAGLSPERTSDAASFFCSSRSEEHTSELQSRENLVC